MKITGFATHMVAAINDDQQNEVTGTWTICVADGQGGTQRYATTSLAQATATLNDWLLAGWPAWIIDNDGHLVHSVGTKPYSFN